MPNIIVGKYKYIDPKEERYLGHEFEKNGVRSLDKRCEYCGKWFTFDIKNVHEWGNNIRLGFNGQPEKIHCGNSLCEDYHVRVIAHERKENEKWTQRGVKLYFQLKGRGIIR